MTSFICRRAYIALILVSGCRAAQDVTGPLGAPALNTAAAEPIATGGGQFDIAVVNSIGTFGFSAVQRDAGATGQLHMQFDLGGLNVEFDGEVTCATFDPVEGRAWIGGVVTRNNSQHPAFTTPRTQPGRDVWFRVLDTGPGPNPDPDRTTIVGFEGDGDVGTSAEYCALQPWAPDNARTWALTAGNITVH